MSRLGLGNRKQMQRFTDLQSTHLPEGDDRGRLAGGDLPAARCHEKSGACGYGPDSGKTAVRVHDLSYTRFHPAYPP